MLRVQAEKTLVCPKKAHIFRSKRNSLRCCQSQLKQRQRSQSRLLILANSYRVQQGRQFFVHNKSVAVYPYIRITRTGAVAYIAAKRRLVVSTLSPAKLSLVSLDHEDETILKQGSIVGAISVDEEKQLVFLALPHPSRIEVMTANGKGFKTILILKWCIGGIAADAKRQIIYVVRCRKYIVKFDYKGVSQGVVVKGSIYKPLCLDPERDALYYMKGKNEPVLYVLLLSQRVSCTIPTPIRPHTEQLYVFSHNLYLTSFNNKTTLVVLNENGKFIETIVTGFSKTKFVAVCGIP